MSPTLTAPASFTVTDSVGRTLRSDRLEVGTPVMERLRIAHRNYQAQGWNCEPLRPPHWHFAAEKAGRRIVIAIRLLSAHQEPRDRSAASA